MARYAAFGLGLLLIMATLLPANVAGSGAKDGKRSLQQVVMSVPANRRLMAIGQRSLQQIRPGPYRPSFGNELRGFLGSIGAPKP